ncbi:response regulator transcription factor [Nocardioides nitrophenolicus]|uniref:response regulator transcription factor n=1 Tax=Nocardioides nitrophenolicus TaxID=60489 RepID=UPI00195EDD19|nr:response regulator transcription factor [Nocardioides nitrophenolicus]MBM7516976.1 DNA-binding NarL/FixJ family response regulator [Nocardioides nitrophenolicus]
MVEVQEGGPAYWRVAIVEDHRLQRLRTEELLTRQAGLRVVHSVETLDELVSWMAGGTPQSLPHLVVLDLVVDRGRDADPAVVERLVRSGMRVLVLSAMASVPLVRAMIRAGVSGFVGKRDTEEDIVAAVWAVLRRRQWITPELASVMAGDAQRPRLSDQEERALVLYASGLTLDAVAAALGVKRDTVKKYLERVKAKYAEVGRPVRTKIDLNREAIRDGLMSPAPLDGQSGAS